MTTALPQPPVPPKGDPLNQLAMNPTVDMSQPGCLGFGITAKRPSGLGVAHTGSFWFDTTLGYPVWWTGAAWHNGAGTVA